MRAPHPPVDPPRQGTAAAPHRALVLLSGADRGSVGPLSPDRSALLNRRGPAFQLSRQTFTQILDGAPLEGWDRLVLVQEQPHRFEDVVLAVALHRTDLG